MKKILFILALILTFSCVLTSCNLPFLPGAETTVTTPEETTPEPNQPHIWSEWIVIKEAKCEEKGLLQRYCTECNYTESKPIDALGHTEVIEEAVAPTCTEAGFTEGKHCSICNEVFIAQVVIEATGHSFGEWITTKEPTVTEEGIMERICACGEKETQIIEKLQPSVGLEYTLNGDSVSYSVTGIGTCTDTDIIIPSEYKGLPVTRIGDIAFFDCSNLTSVTIPDLVTTIGDFAFFACFKFTSFVVDENNTAYQSINGNLYSKDGTVLVAYACGKTDTSFVVPNTVSTIGDDAFYNCDGLTSVTIGDSVTTIGDSAFSGCDNLTSVTIGGSVTTIGDSAFSGCDNLTSVTIGNSVTTIGDSAFYDCDGLTSITVPDSVTTIGSWVFAHCYNLTRVTIPDSVTTIGSRAFYNCSNLTSVTIGDSVTTIGSWAFQGCSNLTSVTIPDSVTSIGSYAFDDCSNLISVTIGDSVTIIGVCAFRDCSKLTSVTIPDSVIAIGEYAFYNCNSALYTEYEFGKYVGDSTNPYAVLIEVTNKNMSTYTIHPDTQVIAYGVFQNCERLTNIAIPNGVRGIGGSAFYNCSNLTSVTFANPNGWDAGSTAISASDLSNPETAAQYLISAYLDYYWLRTE